MSVVPPSHNAPSILAMYAILELRAHDADGKVIVWATKTVNDVEVVPAKGDKIVLRSDGVNDFRAHALIVRSSHPLASLDGYVVMFALDDKLATDELLLDQLRSQMTALGWEIRSASSLDRIDAVTREELNAELVALGEDPVAD